MANILNLDAMVPDQLTIVLDEKEHIVQPASVGTYAAMMKMQEQVAKLEMESEKDAETVTMEQIEFAVDFLAAAIPSIERERLAALHVTQLQALMEGVQSEIEKATRGHTSEGSGGNSTSRTLLESSSVSILDTPSETASA